MTHPLETAFGMIAMAAFVFYLFWKLGGRGDR